MNKKMTEQEGIRHQKIEELKKLKTEPFGKNFTCSHTIENIILNYQNIDQEWFEENKVNVKIAGRIILKRGQGKAGFLHLQDFNFKIQVYLRSDLLGDAFLLYQNCDLGDIVGIKGFLFKTKTKELTIKALDFIHLTKSLKPLPDKFHGLQNREEMRKKRYLDLMVNEKSRQVFLTRSLIIKSIRNFFDNEGFLEVETPILQPSLGGASAKPFITSHNALNSDFYLRIATELPLKKLIVGGMPKVYEIGRIFRNEGMDATHNPEFSTIEAYQAYSDIQGMMELTQKCLQYICQTVLKSLEINYQNKKISFQTFQKISMTDAIKKETGIDFQKKLSQETCLQLAKQHDINVMSHFSQGHIIEAFFEKYVEHKLIQPTFIYGHPLEISPLAKKNLNDPRFTDRFELFIAGKEFVNAFSELNDPIEQEKRFLNQLKQKELGDDEACEMDYDFLDALSYGMPPTGGLGMGIDRIVMLLTDTPNIRDVILFPHFKNKNIIKKK
ncbi:lysine--tRNA ligase [Candidatus Phytoplasma australiense]|uniref:Lysine--tRNA ligase n=1 Tax=Strawberry lethal yellows phytoplasma (CPA) str. NZSb11 TaxID=980422 RepID=R4RLN9_PHYAS|nr:lysine--tRNA ligase [Candidatus Phytoplasma australiense]AGL90250.1 Lysyl-tRNA synthetase [Strawberry lethal yellows phytoplasma (CPA) str. NZSb11]